ncbi:MAG: hypothetical protein Q3999_08440, partial [Buchananella hordeovulneris]|nr:hypothetical protein [Buchananella hordeovulneris]
AHTMTIQISTWNHPRTGQARHYLRYWSQAAGFEVERYNSGNIAGATIAGMSISNTKARAVSDSKIWFADDGQLHIEGGLAKLDADVLEAVRARLITALAAIGYAVK